MSEAAIEPDTKDWTWVLDRPCPECGFEPSVVDPAGIGEAIRANASAWAQALASADATRRPQTDVWSATEYACHVRDVHRVFGERLALMLEQDNPLFANWDQDETAVADRYDLQDPAIVAEELRAAADSVAARYDSVTGDQWPRPGRRGNGSTFTVASIGTYHLHDAVHHRWDVRWLDAR